MGVVSLGPDQCNCNRAHVEPTGAYHRKYFMYDEINHTGDSVYLWESVDGETTTA